ncbi:MAG TPA: hypothetical protein VNI78_12000 [Vicinamibacterales bacterium]|nr:hypothetical protein [Vicinamibacterales bacterium]
MVEVIIKQQLTGDFSTGTEVAQSEATQSSATNAPADNGRTARKDAGEKAMQQKLKSERGLSLIEATIILLVLSVLTAVVAPSMGDFVNDARDVRAKEDVEAIGGAIMRLLRDSRQACLVLDATSASCTETNRVDLLYSDGSNPTVSASSYAIENSAITGTNINWLGHADAATQTDTMENQLVKNTPNGATANAYADPTSFYTKGGPKAGIGWRGAYIAAPVGPDPWGFNYQSNTAFLNVANDVSGTGEGQASGGWRYDVIVISAGRNGNIETPFANATGTGGTSLGGDDVVYVITGTTR